MTPQDTGKSGTAANIILRLWGMASERAVSQQTGQDLRRLPLIWKTSSTVSAKSSALPRGKASREGGRGKAEGGHLFARGGLQAEREKSTGGASGTRRSCGWGWPAR